ncbi:MAG: MATE family efflux transporter [Clostridium sp.]|nr:MATE family efflux transporter [Clostridium sp.]
MKHYKDKYDKMANAPVKKLISSLAVPTIITMLVSAVYNMADSFFVGRIDTSSVASIGIVFSVMTLLQAIGFFLGNGSGILISTYLGEKKKETAETYANVAFFTAFTAGIVMALIGLFFSDKLAFLLGATETTIDAASGYLKYILLGSPFILCSFVLNNQLRYQGSAVYSMAGILSGSILNIAIDPLFIFTFKLGVQGAAIATVISQFIGFIILLLGTRRGENIRITIKKFKPTGSIFLNISKNGLPSLARQGIQTVATICLNFACAKFGDAVVAGMSVFNRVMFLGLAVVIGFGQGYQPVCSFNNGAKNYKRVYEGYKFTAVITTCIITLFSIAGFIFAPQLISLFRDDSQVIEIGARALRIQCIAMPLTGYCTASNMLMQSLKISGKATVLALARQGIFYVPLMLLLPIWFSADGITYVQPIADALSFIMTLLLVTPKVKELKKQ